MEESTLFVGTYTTPENGSEGVYEYCIAGGGAELRRTFKMESPSFLAVREGTLFCVNELEKGLVTSVSLKDGSTKVAESHGIHPCHLAIDHKGLLVTNYTSGTVSSYKADGLELVNIIQ